MGSRIEIAVSLPVSGGPRGRAQFDNEPEPGSPDNKCLVESPAATRVGSARGFHIPLSIETPGRDSFCLLMPVSFSSPPVLGFGQFDHLPSVFGEETVIGSKLKVLLNSACMALQNRSRIRCFLIRTLTMIASREPSRTRCWTVNSGCQSDEGGPRTGLFRLEPRREFGEKTN